ncbi:MAG: hypothetical protein ACRC5M_00470 [Anaeroplasmataceae bacterium]
MMNLNETKNLITFGTELVGYANEKSTIRYFVKKFNEAMGLPENNATGTVKELIKFGSSSSKKELKEWAKEQLDILLSSAEDVAIERETYEVQAPKPKAEAKPKAEKKATTTKKNEKTEEIVENDSLIDSILNGVA